MPASALPRPCHRPCSTLTGARRRRSALASIAPAGLALACGAALPAPSPGLYFPAEGGDGCLPAVTRIEAVDEPTPLGFTAIEALQRLAGPRSSPLEWIEPAANDEYLLTLGPEGGRSSLDLDLRLREGPVLHRFRTPSLIAPDDVECDPGAIEIPISVTLQSGEQGLAESFDAWLEARVPYRGHLSGQLEPSALRGGLGLAHVTSLDPERVMSLGPVSIEADVWEGGSDGSVSVQLRASHARASSELRLPPDPPAQPGIIAAWPSMAACDADSRALPTDAKVLGFSVDDVLAELRRGEPRQAVWSDGSQAPLALELDTEASELCQRVGESLSFTATLRARSDDGLDLRSAVRIEALDAGGRVGTIRIESAEPNSPHPFAGALSGPAGSGGYDAVLVGVDWTHDGSADSGSLSLRGVDASAPDTSGVYPSSALTSARW